MPNRQVVAYLMHIAGPSLHWMSEGELIAIGGQWWDDLLCVPSKRVGVGRRFVNYAMEWEEGFARWLILQTPKQFLRIANSIWDAFSSGIISNRAVTARVFFSRKRSCDSGQPMCEPERSTPAVGMRLMSTGNADRSVSLGQNSSHFSNFTSKPVCFPSVDKISKAFSKSA